MSLFSDYIKERKNRNIIETEHGFVTYGFTSQDECYLEDMYIVPQFRRKKHGTALVNELFNKAKEGGAKVVYTTIVPTTNGSTASLLSSLQYGFKLLRSEPNVIFLIKEV